MSDRGRVDVALLRAGELVTRAGERWLAGLIGVPVNLFDGDGGVGEVINLFCEDKGIKDVSFDPVWLARRAGLVGKRRRFKIARGAKR